jgi:hypothetical protein
VLKRAFAAGASFFLFKQTLGFSSTIKIRFSTPISVAVTYSVWSKDSPHVHGVDGNLADNSNHRSSSRASNLKSMGLEMQALQPA